MRCFRSVVPGDRPTMGGSSDNKERERERERDIEKIELKTKEPNNEGLHPSSDDT